MDVQLLENTEKFLENLLITIAQCKVLLEAIPEEPSFGEDIIEIPVLSPESQTFSVLKNDAAWTKSSSNATELISIAHKLHVLMEKTNRSVPSAELRLANPKFVLLQDKDNLISNFESLLLKLRELQGFFGKMPVSDSLAWLESDAAELKGNYEVINEFISSDGNDDDVKLLSQQLMEKMLVIMQNIYKKYAANEQTTDAEDEDDYTLHDNHFKVMILQNLNEDLNHLQFKDLFKLLHKTCTAVFTNNPSVSTKNTLCHLIPLLEQTSLFHQYYITQQVSAYRTTCKMTSILLNIFIELLSKGFCIPPELSGEVDSEGQSQSSGGLGLGDGEGEKDVSDRIESEDQLEDAQPAGQEKEKEEEKECKEEEKGIEMSEDFEGKLQDLEGGNEEEGSERSDSEQEEQMGETGEESEKLDRQIWDADEDEAVEEGWLGCVQSKAKH